MVDVDGLAGGGLDVLQRVGDDREVAQPQEVHLEQAEVLDLAAVVLGDDFAVAVDLQRRDDVGDRFVGDHHTGGVDGVLPPQALEALGQRDDLAAVGVLGRGVLELAGLLEGIVERRLLALDRRREHLAEPVAEGVRQPEHPGGVLDGLLGLDGLERHDLGDVVLTVLVGGVADHLHAPALVEVHVDVGHGDALGVEEPLEQQAVVDRVEVGDARDVGHRAARGRPTSRTDTDAHVAGVLDHVGHDQEVRGEAHLLDDAQLVLQPLADLVAQAVVGGGVVLGSVAADRPDTHLLAQQALLVVPGRARELGQVHGVEVELDVAPLGDQQRVLPRLRVVGEQRLHLLGRLHVELVVVELEAVGVGLQ